MDMPAFQSAETVQRFRLRDHSVVLYRDIVAAGTVKYLYLMMVFAGAVEAMEAAVYCVASEVNTMAEELGGGSHFLGVFEGGSHINYGSSNHWAQEASFTTRALELVTAKFGPLVG